MPEVSLKSKLLDLGYNVDIFSSSTEEAFRVALAGIAKGAHAEWIRLAQTRLHTSRFDYINGLRQADSFTAKVVAGQPVFEIRLVGRMPNNYEFGMDSFDMKMSRPGWLGGSKAKVNQEGKSYVRIPFRHSTSESSARFRYTGKAARENLKTELRNTVKQYGLNRMIKRATGEVVEGPVARVPKVAGVHRYLQGLTRIQKPTSDPKRGQSMLMTWRTMSESSPEDSWIHPGLDGAKLLPEVEKWVDNEIKRIAEKVLGAA